MPQSMFRNPFSFSGRIRRLEYGFSYIIFIVGVFIFGALTESFNGDESPFILIYMIAGYWFMLAQGTKRCHDMGQSGFFQFIPFYGLIMLFSEGDRRPNKYGPDPKDETQPNPIPPFRLQVELPEGKTRLEVINEMLCLGLLNTLFFVMIRNYIPLELLSYLGMVAALVGCYYLLLLMTHKKEPLPELPPYWFRHRWLYAIIVYGCFWSYRLIFEQERFTAESFSYGCCAIVMLLVLTYIPFLIYKHYYNKIKEVVVYEE